MADIILNVEVRERAGTGGAREVRRAGRVPGVLYGHGKDPVNISVVAKDFKKSLHTGKLLGHLVTLKYGEETQPVIAKAVQFDPVTDEAIHFDLFRVGEHDLIKINVPVHFKNHDISPGLKAGGSLEVVRHDVELACPADQIPEELIIDLAIHNIGDTIRMSEVKLPNGVRPSLERDFVIATLKASASAVSEGAEGESAEA